MAANGPPVMEIARQSTIIHAVTGLAAQEIARLDKAAAKLQAAHRGHSTRKLAAKAAAAKAASDTSSSWAEGSSSHSVGLAGRLQELRYAMWITLNEPSSSSLASVYSYVMMAVILTSIGNFVIGSFPDDYCRWTPRYDGESNILPDARRQCSGSRIEETSISMWIEAVSIFAFTGEYVGRLLTCGVVMPVGRFLCSPLNLLDLLAIMPWYITQFLEEGAGQFFSIVRLVRLARIFRIFKASKEMKLMRVLGRTLQRSGLALSLLCVAVLVFMLFWGAIIAVFEHGKYNEEVRNYLRESGAGSPFYSIPQAMYYCMTSMSTVGYGDLFPETPSGQLAGIFSILLGIVTLSLPITVIGQTFAEEFEEMKRIDQRNRRSCKLLEQEELEGARSELEQGELDHRVTSEPALPGRMGLKRVPRLVKRAVRTLSRSPDKRRHSPDDRRPTSPSVLGFAQCEWLLEDSKHAAGEHLKQFILRSELDLLRMTRKVITMSRVCTKKQKRRGSSVNLVKQGASKDLLKMLDAVELAAPADPLPLERLDTFAIELVNGQTERSDTGTVRGFGGTEDSSPAAAAPVEQLPSSRPHVGS